MSDQVNDKAGFEPGYPDGFLFIPPFHPGVIPPIACIHGSPPPCNPSPSTVPEPSMTVFFLLAFLAFMWYRKKTA